MKRKTCLSFLVILILLARCSKTTSHSASDTAPTHLTWEFSSNLSTINWMECDAMPCLQHATLVMEGLFKTVWKSEDWELENALASDIRSTKSGILISIKKNIFWTDAKQLTSDDFLIGWKRVLSKCQTLDRFPSFRNVSGTAGYCRSEKKWTEVGIKARDENTIEITFEKNADPLTQEGIARSLSHPWFFPHRGARKNSATLGPFFLKEDQTRNVDASALYVVNPRYHGPKPPVDEILLKTQLTQAGALTSVLSRQVQLAGPFDEDSGLDNVEPRSRLIMPGPKRYAVATTFPPATPSAADQWNALSWTEPQKLAAPHALPCSATRLCALTEPPVRNPPSKKLPIALALSSDNPLTARLADNLAAQWKALTQAKVLLASSARSAHSNQSAVHARVFTYASTPFQNIFPSVDLATACQQYLAVNPWRQAGKPEINESDIKRMESNLWKQGRCVPLAAQALNFVRDPELSTISWTAHQTWDLSRATLPPKRKAKPSPGG